VVRSVSLVLDLLAPVNISYNRITELKVLTYFGQAVKTPIGEPNRLMIVGQIALFIFLAVCVDAAVFAIKRGEIRKMLFAAVSTIVFVVAGVVNSILIFWGIVELPLVATPFYLCIVFAMLFELTHTASHAVQLATALEQREELLSVHEHRVRVAEQTAHEMSGRLIGAQEVERARLARELHDDLSQNLALLSIKLGMLPERSDGETAFQDHVDDLSGHLRTLATDVHRISHELHPSKLEQLGLVPAIRGFCRDIGQARNLSVEFTATDTPPELPADISLCLYRVVQEALQNVAKHSGASTANVSLAVSDGSITLSVSDDGKGFDPSIPIAKQSLGLVGMNERVRSVRGYLTTESVPGHGTTIIVKVPLITTERL
jgi:signal transduction histidine kinase